MAVDDLLPAYTAHLREHNCTPKSIKTYTRTIRVADRDLPYGLDIATDDEIRAWLWRDGLQLSSRATYRKALRSFFYWAVYVAEHVDLDPMEDVARVKVPRGLPRVASDAQVRRVMTEAADPYRLWGALAAYAGLRCIEVFRLHREHVTQEAIRVYRGKGEKARVIHTHPIIWTLIKDFPEGPITGAEDEEEISNKFLCHCRDRLKVRGLSMHRLRGWFATQGYRATKNLLAVQESMGHADPAQTARYIEVNSDELQAVVTSLPVFCEDGDVAG